MITFLLCVQIGRLLWRAFR